MFHVVLVEPEIPQNTGNISRTCACTGSALHIVRPIGFEISDRTVRRAGLDYWDKLQLTLYDSFDEVRAAHADAPFFFLSTKAERTYTQATFPDGSFLVFGKETKGLPEDLLRRNAQTALRIPMGKHLRSLNLSNSVAIVLYEALRQQNFLNLC